MSRTFHHHAEIEPLSIGRTRCGMTHKVCFNSHEEAVHRITEFLGVTPVMRSYRCQYCGTWHLTSKPAR